MSGFPLYDNLIKDLPKKDLRVKEKEEFIQNIKRINMDGLELVYALILVYAGQNEKEDKTFHLPYKGIKEEEDDKGLHTFSWVYTQFPIKLRHLLSRFVTIHLKKQEEEATRISAVETL
jgi:hypothetical protein